MPPITIPNLGQQGAPGVPLTVQSAPSGQPTLSSPVSAPTPSPSAPVAAPSDGTDASNISPLYQQFFAGADQIAQAGVFQDASGNAEKPSNSRGIAQDIAGPELNAAASGGRAIEATPSIIQGIGEFFKQLWNDPESIKYAIAHPNEKVLNLPAIQKAQDTLSQSVGNVKTFAGMTNKELLGSAVQAAGQALMVGGPEVSTTLGKFLSGATSFGLQAGGNAAASDKSAGQIAADAALGAVGGGLGELAAPMLGKAAGAVYDTLTPEAVKSTVSAAGSAIGKAGGAVADSLGSILDKYVPSISERSLLDPIINKTAPVLTKLFTSTSGDAAGDAFGSYLSGLKKASVLRTTLGDEMSALSGELTRQFPDATINLSTSQVKAIQTAAQKAGISLPEFMNVANTAQVAGEDVTNELGSKLPGVDLTISQAQDLGTSLNKAYEKGYVESVYDDLRQTIRTSLDQAHPGLGTVYDQMYDTASKGYQALESLDDIFNSKNRSPNSSDLLGGIHKIQSLSSDPTGQKILSTMLDNFKTSTGIDLSSETGAVAAAGKIKDPLAKRAALTAIKIIKTGGGWAGALDLVSHVLK